ncbi:MAG TPA: hypothetical protein P5205_19530 [Candidatus Paceibacterota bacterium]|nr:hypothetical protein [Verrucomicrobiota bacterium]HSA12557.1 hypothetical protein [Candidatus Paceibacterota bacterium]
MIIKGNNSKFEACPEYTGKGVCVDATPLRKQQSQFGERDVFKLVFEVDLLKTDGSRYCVWSKNFTPSTNEKANFRKFVRGWFGRDLTRAELEDFDTECLIGKPAQLVVVQEHKDGETYANIVACTPDKSGEPLKPSGKYVRVKDRPPRDSGQRSEGGGQSGYRRAEQPGSEVGGQRPEVSDHAAVKIHVGRCKGLELRDLAPEQVQALVEKWLPTAKANAKPTADDRRLMAALEWWAAAREREEDDVAF